MSNIFMIAKNNMKKQKGDMITFLIMMFLTSFLLFDCVSLITGVKKVYEDKFEATNAPDIMLFIHRNEKGAECMEKALKENNIEEFEMTPILYVSADYKNKDAKDFANFPFVIENSENKNTMLNVFPEDVSLNDGEIYIPYTMQSTVDIDDILLMKINGKEFEFKVKGFTENPLFCSTTAASMNYVYLSEADYKEIESLSSGKITSDIMLAYFYKCKADDKVTDMDALQQNISDDYNLNISKLEEKETDTSYDIVININKDLMLFGNTMFPYVSIGFIAVFAVMILVIALIIISFSISNFIQRNMKNTGILEACGYKVSELKNALTVQIMSVAVSGTAIGLAMALVSLPSAGEILKAVMGITWTSNTNMIPILITGTSLLLIVFSTTRIISRKYNNISVLDALRGGINTHNFKKNRFAFSKTRLPVALVLSLKETFGNLGKNIALALIIAILTVSAIIGFALKENFSSDKNGMMDVMGIEMGTAGITAIEGIGDDLRALQGVKNVYECQNKILTLEFNGQSYIYNTYGVADSKYAINTVVTEGRQPEADNEIMLTHPISMQTGAGIGDVVTITNGDHSEAFVVTGINQRLEQAGKTMAMTLDGFERIDARSNYNDYYVTAEDGVTYDELKKTLEDYGRSKGLELGITNTGELIEGTINGMISTFDIVNVIIMIITTFIVIFVESLVIRAKITREWRNMGINKALGMTSGNLIGQITLSNIPVIITGCLIGALSSGFVGRSMMLIIFSYLGLQKLTLKMPLVLILATVAGIILVAALTSAFEGLRIRKLIPMEMITEE